MSEPQYIHGLHAARAAIKYDPAHIVEVWVEKGRKDAKLERLLESLQGGRVPLHRVSRQELERLAPGGVHQGIVLSYRGAAPRGEPELEALLDSLDEPPFLLVLDQVQDPHNLGACLRSADAAGVHGVIAPRDRAAGLTPTVHKVASGAAQSVPFFQVTNLARSLRALRERGIWLVGAAGEGDATVYQADLTGPLAVLMGAEESGLRRLSRELCDQLAAIPMAGQVESLNVSVAAGVFLFEAVRQRLKT